MRRTNHTLAALALGLALGLPAHAQAQTMAYDGSGAISGKDGGGDEAGPSDASGDTGGGARKKRKDKRVSITPYIEAMQIANAELSPGNDFLTYTSLAAGVDALFNGRRTKGAVSLRYERRFGYGKVADSDTLSGIARIAYALAPEAVNLEVGALAARTQIQPNGQVVVGTPQDGSSSSQIYSIYAGPVLKTMVGDVEFAGGYRIGYSKVKNDSGFVSAPDTFDSSLIQNAELRAGIKPGVMLPFGIGVGAGYYQENVSLLDQRVRDFHARADVSLPVSSDLALVGGVGYENVQISSRDALRDGAGNPVIGSDGRYVTDKSGPRIMAYDTSGLIWDAGVMWRPSKRTALEAHVGRRYGSTTYYGSLSYAPNSRSSFNVSVYDNVVGFGGQLNNALAALPTSFEAIRNPLTGNIGGCVASLQGGACLNSALGSVRSATFRARGVSASYAVDLGRIQAGLAVGYDRRKFVAAPGTVLAASNGTTDQNYWASAYFNGRIDQASSFGTNAWVSKFDSGFNGDDGTAIGASAAYFRSLTNKLTATAAVGIDGIERSNSSLDDIWNASALVGVRYSF